MCHINSLEVATRWVQYSHWDIEHFQTRSLYYWQTEQYQIAIAQPLEAWSPSNHARQHAACRILELTWPSHILIFMKFYSSCYFYCIINLGDPAKLRIRSILRLGRLLHWQIHERTSECTLHVAAQDVELDFTFGQQPVLSFYRPGLSKHANSYHISQKT